MPSGRAVKQKLTGLARLRGLGPAGQASAALLIGGGGGSSPGLPLRCIFNAARERGAARLAEMIQLNIYKR